MNILETHKKEIQEMIESMSSGSEMAVSTIYKKYTNLYPLYEVYEEIQRVLKLNLRRYRFFRRDSLLQSVIARTEDYV